MKSPSKNVWIDDTSGWPTNMLLVYLGHHDPAGFMATYAEPIVKLTGFGPIYHEYIPPGEEGGGGGGCIAVDEDGVACTWEKSEHGTPRLTAKITGWQMTQSLVPAVATPHENMAALRIPIPLALELGEALVAWAKSSTLAASDDGMAPAHVLFESLEHERARSGQMLDTLLAVLRSTTGAADDAEPGAPQLFAEGGS